MENRNNQNYGHEYHDYNNDLDTLIEKENTNQTEEYQSPGELINDINHETNDYNRNENNPGEEPILNGEDQITNDEDPDDLDDSLEKDGDLDDDDFQDEENLRNIDEDLDEVSHDPFPSTNSDNF